jgi:transposase
MPKQTKIQPHLTIEELETNYRKATDPVERSQWQIIWLLAQNRKVTQVVEVTSYSPGWIRELARRYNRDGATALGDKRHHAPGATPLLSAELQSELFEAVQHPHSDGGMWTGPKVTAWIEAKTGRKLRRQRGWEYLTKLDFTLQQPRPHHAKADEVAQAEFKKNYQIGLKKSKQLTQTPK